MKRGFRSFAHTAQICCRVLRFAAVNVRDCLKLQGKMLAWGMQEEMLKRRYFGPLIHRTFATSKWNMGIAVVFEGDRVKDIKSFRDLRVWQLGKEIVVNVYRVTRSFPKEELYGITSQMRRSAVSIPANISEGFNRYYYKEQIRFSNIALGSCAELDTFLEISLELGYLQKDDYERLSDKINHESRMLMKRKIGICEQVFSKKS